MAKIAKPRQKLVYLWRKALNEDTYPVITRAYHRYLGKFVPIGWYLEDGFGNTRVFTDTEVDALRFN